MQRVKLRIVELLAERLEAEGVPFEISSETPEDTEYDDMPTALKLIDCGDYTDGDTTVDDAVDNNSKGPLLTLVE